MFTTPHIPKSTRQPETALCCGGWVAPVGPTPTAMLLRHAGADDESRHSIPAIAMIDAGEPWTHLATMTPIRRSGVKSTIAGNSSAMVSLSPERARKEGDTSRRKKEPAQSDDRKPQGGRHTLEPKGKGHATRETGWKPHRKFGSTFGSLAEAPAGCSAPPRTQQCRKKTWTPSRALGPQGPSRTLAARARRAGRRPSKCPGQRLGYAEFGTGTSRPTNKQHP
jgi:hypothetical protein